jgi:hypothetical protein
MNKYLVVCALLIVTGIAYAKDTTVTKKLDLFSVVRVIGMAGVIVEHGDQPQISITTKGKEKDIIKTKVANDTLAVYIDSPDRPGDLIVKAAIQAPKYKTLILDGVGSITSNGSISVDSLNIRVNGTGKIEVKIDTKSLFSRTAGAGKIVLAGKSVFHDMHVSGAGRIKASLLDTKQSNVLIEGAGLCNVKVEKELSVKIYGTGKVTYMGSPKVSKKIYGLGRVKQKAK